MRSVVALVGATFTRLPFGQRVRPGYVKERAQAIKIQAFLSKREETINDAPRSLIRRATAAFHTRRWPLHTTRPTDANGGLGAISKFAFGLVNLRFRPVLYLVGGRADLFARRHFVPQRFPSRLFGVGGGTVTGLVNGC